MLPATRGESQLANDVHNLSPFVARPLGPPGNLVAWQVPHPDAACFRPWTAPRRRGRNVAVRVDH